MTELRRQWAEYRTDRYRPLRLRLAATTAAVALLLLALALA